uniref:Phosphopantothenoylcysteine decarboxylase n=1 Tax=Parascaris equorum TaxID=6256 RepID=A0A914S0R9_PAREQ
MNSAMWENPITYQQRKILKDLLRYKVSDYILVELIFVAGEIPPIEKELMCGERGYGAMATVQMIASIVASD